MISASLVKQLREITGAGMMDCKKALKETNGDLEAAVEYLREKGISSAAKKSSRIASEGLVAVYTSEDGKVASMVEVNSETDFVSKNDAFKSFTDNLAKLVADTDPKDLDDLKSKEYENGQTVEETLTELIATIGENMSIRRFARVESDTVAESYNHGDGKIGVLVELEGGNSEVAKDISMQIAALAPEYLDETEIPEDVLNHEKEIIRAQTLNEGKPEAIAEKIVEGRIQKFYEEVCLVHQTFVKDGSKKVKDILAENDAKIVKYHRFEKGEGLEKRNEDFAKEVMDQLNQ